MAPVLWAFRSLYQRLTRPECRISPHSTTKLLNKERNLKSLLNLMVAPLLRLFVMVCLVWLVVTSVFGWKMKHVGWLLLLFGSFSIVAAGVFVMQSGSV